MHLQLTAVEFEILLALADEPRHGYGVMQEIERRGRTKMRAGTLYRAINRMVGDGYIAETRGHDRMENDDQRRRYYRLTSAGKRVASAEAQRLARLVEGARRKKLLRASEG